MSTTTEEKMESQTLKQRTPASTAPPNLGVDIKQNGKTIQVEHPGGAIKHKGPMQLFRMLTFSIFFFGCCVVIVITQCLGAPLYWMNRDLYYAYMALTKQSFGLTITTMTQLWSPTTMRISGDESVKGQLRKTADGRVEYSFPERLVLTANHQLYFDWIYLWWACYTNDPQMHGHIFIILKESLKYLPVLGQGMMFFGFIFMSRKFDKDKPRIAHRLATLKSKHNGPLSGPKGLDPMWLLVFPEGTNVSENTRANSAKWAAKKGIPDFIHQVMPRSTGMFFVLNELKGTMDYVYDVTVGYEGVARGQYGQDFFTLRSAYFEGRPPKSVNMYWRRLPVSEMPLDDADKFDEYMLAQWKIKDDLLEIYMQNGRFPPSSETLDDKAIESETGYIETAVETKHWWEFFNIFIVLAAVVMVVRMGLKSWNGVFH